MAPNLASKVGSPAASPGASVASVQKQVAPGSFAIPAAQQRSGLSGGGPAAQPARPLAPAALGAGPDTRGTRQPAAVPIPTGGDSQIVRPRSLGAVSASPPAGRPGIAVAYPAESNTSGFGEPLRDESSRLTHGAVPEGVGAVQAGLPRMPSRETLRSPVAAPPSIAAANQSGSLQIQPPTHPQSPASHATTARSPSGSAKPSRPSPDVQRPAVPVPMRGKGDGTLATFVNAALHHEEVGRSLEPLKQDEARHRTAAAEGREDAERRRKQARDLQGSSDGDKEVEISSLNLTADALEAQAELEEARADQYEAAIQDREEASGWRVALAALAVQEASSQGLERAEEALERAEQALEREKKRRAHKAERDKRPSARQRAQRNSARRIYKDAALRRKEKRKQSPSDYRKWEADRDATEAAADAPVRQSLQNRADLNAAAREEIASNEQKISDHSPPKNAEDRQAIKDAKAALRDAKQAERESRLSGKEKDLLNDLKRREDERKKRAEEREGEKKKGASDGDAKDKDKDKDEAKEEEKKTEPKDPCAKCKCDPPCKDTETCECVPVPQPAKGRFKRPAGAPPASRGEYGEGRGKGPTEFEGDPALPATPGGHLYSPRPEEEHDEPRVREYGFCKPRMSVEEAVESAGAVMDALSKYYDYLLAWARQADDYATRVALGDVPVGIEPPKPPQGGVLFRHPVSSAHVRAITAGIRKVLGSLEKLAKGALSAITEVFDAINELFATLVAAAVEAAIHALFQIIEATCPDWVAKELKGFLSWLGEKAQSVEEFIARLKDKLKEHVAAELVDFLFAALELAGSVGALRAVVRRLPSLVNRPPPKRPRGSGVEFDTGHPSIAPAPAHAPRVDPPKQAGVPRGGLAGARDKIREYAIELPDEPPYGAFEAFGAGVPGRRRRRRKDGEDDDPGASAPDGERPPETDELPPHDLQDKRDGRDEPPPRTEEKPPDTNSPSEEASPPPKSDDKRRPRNLPPPIPKGKWEPEPGWETRSDRALDYEQKIGAPKDRGHAYEIHGTRTGFDGYDADRGVMLEAKGPGYADKKKIDADGRFTWFKKPIKDWPDQARRQLRATPDNPIEWHFAEERALEAAKLLFERARIPLSKTPVPGKITLRFTPP